MDNLIEFAKEQCEIFPEDSDMGMYLRETLKILQEEPCKDAVSRAELLKIYEDRFTELQKLKHLKDNKGAEDRQMGVNYCINILKELPPVTPTRKKEKCEFCELGKPLAIGKTNDQGIAIHYPNILNAYGYDIHGFGSNGISVKINYCPICGAEMKSKE